ncbi:MAG: DNA primase [Planctomycetaceae bacterium]|nr:DNA primase [Planctomycetaceae bacterium]
MNNDDVKRQVQQATDIVALIGEQVSLRARGREFVGLCPFHDDKKPSLNVVPAKQIFKCFACGAGGDVFSFVIDYHKMTFPEAMRHLADRANIRLPAYRGQRDGDGPSMRERLLGANQQALQYFQRQLQDDQAGQAARQYIASRRISDEMVRDFQFGYAPDGWEHLVNAIAANRWDGATFEQLGLIGARDNGSGYFDRLRHRLIFPICDALGRPVAFGGRKLREEDEPKYLNSPETALFNKSATLFGLDLAKKPIIDAHTAVIVEGYTDVIACHQAGARNVVATLGTALTVEHARELRRFCDRAILIFDADEAGQKAADRALEVFFHEPLDIQIGILPDGLDPADLLAKDNGLSMWKQSCDDAVDVMTFAFGRLVDAYDQTDTMAGRQRLVEDYLRRLVQLGYRQLDPIRRGMVIPRLTDLLRIDAGALNDVIRKIGGATRSRETDVAPESAAKLNARRRAEQQLVGCLLNRPELFHATMPDGRSLDESVLPDDMEHEPTRVIYEVVHQWLVDHEPSEEMTLRGMMDGEREFRDALDLQDEADRLNDSDPTRIEQNLRNAAAVICQTRADEAYAQQQQHVRDAEEVDDDERDSRRLAMAVAHARANPSAARIPRVETS